YRERGYIYVAHPPLDVSNRTSHGFLHCPARTENPGMEGIFGRMAQLPLCAPVHLLITPARIATAESCRTGPEEQNAGRMRPAARPCHTTNRRGTLSSRAPAHSNPALFYLSAISSPLPGAGSGRSLHFFDDDHHLIC